jgi:cyclic di-GMP phosphodiesterase
MQSNIADIALADEKKIIDPLDIEIYEEKVGAPFRDSLTGLVNHGFFSMTLDREAKRSKRFGAHVSVGLIGIDSFKLFNKSKGNLEGDRILKLVADCIQTSIRGVDLAARLYGDLFAVIFTESTIENAVKAAERIRRAIATSTNNAITVSIGFSGHPQDTDNASVLLKRAYEAFIQAKTKGQNCILYDKDKFRTYDSSAPKVLIVDDIPQNLKLLNALLLPLQYDVLKADNGETALDIVNKENVDLVMLDVMMPGLDGFEVCRRIRQNPNTRMIPVILVTALDDNESKIKGIEAGADDFISKPPNKQELIARTKSLIKLKRLNNNLTDIENVLFSMAKAVEAKDAYTQGHIERVSNLSIVLGRELNLGEREIEALKYGGILHDIGKIGIPNEILNKPGKLNEEEWETMKTHTQSGYEIGLPLEKNLGAALDVIRCHHEKMDGSGYPDGLNGEDIPIVARIAAVADIYDALITDRPYRKGMTRQQACEILLQEAEEGKLDKNIVRKLLDYFDAK